MLTLRLAQRARLSPSRPSAWARRRRPIRGRPFTHNTQLLLISRPPPRAELPYLYSTPLSRLQGAQGFSQLSFRDRLFTIREVKTWRDFVFTAFQGTLLFFTAYTAFQMIAYGYFEDEMETAHPTPHEWSFKTRSTLRRAFRAEDSILHGTAVPDWVGIGRMFEAIVARLEDKTLEGSSVTGQLGSNEDIYVEGVGKTGLDVSACSEPWRRGYFHALMGAGRCAERYDGTVKDTKSNTLFPMEFVVGPSNLDPKPMLPGSAKEAPREEDCVPVGQPPETFYLKILTTKGFNTGQRLRAALAYADWLRYKGLTGAARSMHTWAIDIAAEGTARAAVGDAAKDTARSTPQFIDRETGVISPTLPNPTANILLAAESMGSHHALTGDLAAALPVYLSVLRAQQSLPASPEADLLLRQRTREEVEAKKAGLLAKAWRLWYPDYPPAPPTGNEPATRSPDSVCASASTMAHIGELLFASDLPSLAADLSGPSANGDGAKTGSWSLFSSKTQATAPTKAQEAGMAWTRQAADLAEASLKALEPKAAGLVPRKKAPGPLSFGGEGNSQGGSARLKNQQRRCADCLSVAVENWSKMVERFERAEVEAAMAQLPSAARSGHSSAANTGGAEATAAAERGGVVFAGKTARSSAAAKAKDALSSADKPSDDAASPRSAELHKVRAQIQHERDAEQRGWNMFWSQALGVSKREEPPKLAADVGGGGGVALGEAAGLQRGVWAQEARVVRDRMRAARMLIREMRLE